MTAASSRRSQAEAERLLAASADRHRDVDGDAEAESAPTPSHLDDLLERSDIASRSWREGLGRDET